MHIKACEVSCPSLVSICLPVNTSKSTGQGQVSLCNGENKGGKYKFVTKYFDKTSLKFGNVFIALFEIFLTQSQRLHIKHVVSGSEQFPYQELRLLGPVVLIQMLNMHRLAFDAWQCIWCVDMHLMPEPQIETMGSWWQRAPPQPESSHQITLGGKQTSNSNNQNLERDQERLYRDFEQNFRLYDCEPVVHSTQGSR